MTLSRQFPTLFLRIQWATLLIIPLCTISANAAPSPSDFDGWKKTLKIELSNRGLPSEIVNLAINNTSRSFAPQNKSHRQAFAEKTSQQLIAEGFLQRANNFRNNNRELLHKVARKYKISEHFILTLWGMETGFSHAAQPDIRVIDSLVYRVYQNNRDYQSKQELIALLKSIDQGGTELSQLQSKSDGTIGQINLQASMYRRYAVDQDEDGEIDLWNSVSDNIASAANVLSHNGWKHGEPWGYEIKLPADTDRSMLGLTQQFNIETLKAHGITLINNQEIPKSDALASIIQATGGASSSYIVFNNFFSLLRWHRSAEFALTFGLLSDKLDQSRAVDAIIPMANAVATVTKLKRQ